MEPPPGPVVVDDRVAGNSIQPGVHGTDLGPLDVDPVQAHEHVLGDVLGRGRIFDSSSDELEQLRATSTPRHHPRPWQADDRWLSRARSLGRGLDDRQWPCRAHLPPTDEPEQGKDATERTGHGLRPSSPTVVCSLSPSRSLGHYATHETSRGAHQ